VQVEQLRPGLWRWTAPHPAWKQGFDWPQDVGCVYVETADATVLIDPLVPSDDAERFWNALDRDVERRGLPVAVVLTAPWHRRSADAVAERFGVDLRLAWAHSLPAGIEPIPVPPREEGQVALFLVEHGALVTAEVLVTERGQLAVAPSPALADDRALIPMLEQLAVLPVELVLPSHGAPITSDAAEAVRAAVARYRVR
jgi:glyoxylase-like metal-dependent hydrolase (beta-lactamase superfamily II)